MISQPGGHPSSFHFSPADEGEEGPRSGLFKDGASQLTHLLPSEKRLNPYEFISCSKEAEGVVTRERSVFQGNTLKPFLVLRTRKAFTLLSKKEEEPTLVLRDERGSSVSVGNTLNQEIKQETVEMIYR